MGSPILFLDIDGVLNSLEYKRLRRHLPRPTGDSIDAVAVARLNRLLAVMGADIVVSSSWRLVRAVESLAVMLGAHGVTGRVIDKTPCLDIVGAGAIVVAQPRGHEIQAWLDAHPAVTRFVILDDGDDMEHLTGRQVRTRYEVGLTEGDVERAASLLQQQGAG